MKLVSYNIHYGFGRDGTNDLDRISDEIEGADVIALQEVERFWPRSGMVDQLAALAKRLPNHWVAFGANLDLYSPAGFAGEVTTNRRQFGNAIFSNRPLLSQTNLSLPRPVGSQQTMQRGALEVVVDSDAGPVRIYSTHLDFLSAATRATQLRAIAQRHKSASVGGGAWEGRHAVTDGWLVGDEPAATPHAIVLGDLNVAFGSREHAIALNQLHGFSDVWAELGYGHSGHTKDGERIDHAWVTDGINSRLVAAWVDSHASGSDHLPAWFEIDL